MDIEFDFDSEDKIKQFFKLYLEEIKEANKNLEESLQTRQDLCTQYHKETVTNSFEENAVVSDIWKKIVHNKYVLGIKLSNTSM